MKLIRIGATSINRNCGLSIKLPLKSLSAVSDCLANGKLIALKFSQSKMRNNVVGRWYNVCACHFLFS